MKTHLFGLAVCALSTGGLLVSASAAPANHAKNHANSHAKKAATTTCPVCKMKVSSKPSAHAKTPVKINGATYYCCSACKMPASKSPAVKKNAAKKSVTKKASVGSAVQVKTKTAAAPSCCAHSDE